MSKHNGKVPGTYVSEKELSDLGEFLTTIRDYLVSHEARLELIEGWIGEYHKAHTPFDEVEANGTEEATGTEIQAEEDKTPLYSATDDETWDAIEANESADDSSEG